jgi:hypothetical protein
MLYYHMSMDTTTTGPGLDRYGMLLSLLCLVHCLALPAVFALLPAAAAVLPPNFWVHLVLFGLALPISGMALVIGYRRHGRTAPLVIGGLGLTLIFSGLLVGSISEEIAVTVVGGLLVVCAHFINRGASRLAAIIAQSHPAG